MSFNGVCIHGELKILNKTLPEISYRFIFYICDIKEHTTRGILKHIILKC